MDGWAVVLLLCKHPDSHNISLPPNTETNMFFSTHAAYATRDERQFPHTLFLCPPALFSYVTMTPQTLFLPNNFQLFQLPNTLQVHRELPFHPRCFRTGLVSFSQLPCLYYR